MRVLLQRVSRASVSTDGKIVGSIDRGYVLLLGVLAGDTEAQADWLAEKISKLRLFDSADGKINDRSILDIEGSVLVVSQFTLAGDTRKGNRPDYTDAAPPAQAVPLYEHFIGKLRSCGIAAVQSGVFGAMMAVELVNDGPVTLMLER
ncbi:TPA: D-tyrosyl-tRNA(Tyr) deacylase [Candidatus Peribacteria bacterium]|nr:MAG: D-tyrosyl-tRNA(Tyr) deacylase [Candidatus Peribacteria bacterium RIFOXYC2_FULL_58_10]OGJ85173.1 MAG: D-tyrosyl-tRNA(Tyr) deacylase [Candidatus Peribacteria bacterium RIFOXYD2_FULL_58_15]HAI98089.1 D-tyrosyl-tRNA(Tyr) deacylase [Candidatus Peribacteria bacterium]HAS33869.1 D-tyrosyl-tRNA(Tyr) deacylase [Candidatus Peribacteria bacterium]